VNRGIALLVVGAVAAAPAPLPVQLAFAIMGIGVVGMVHGAGDLAVVESARRPLFLAAYGVVSLVTLLWWTTDPAIALPAFLVASAVHFGMEDAPNGARSERIARGGALIAGPATLHAHSYAALLRTAGGPSSLVATYTPILEVTGGAAVILLLLLAWQRRDVPLAGGVTALHVLPARGRARVRGSDTAFIRSSGATTQLRPQRSAGPFRRHRRARRPTPSGNTLVRVSNDA
jgi:hypothetical protein